MTENLQLRRRLEQLLEQAERNQEILRLNQAFHLLFIAAASFRELIDSIFHSFAEAAKLDVVTLFLLDSKCDIRRTLVELEIHLSDLPQLFFLQDESELGELSTRLSEPVLGTYIEQLHGSIFPQSVAPPASIAIVPLVRRGTLIGCLGLGSNDAARFTPDMETDFITHMASILAICMENVVNIEQLKHIGLIDPLTGINNRRYVERRLLEEIGRSRRHGYALSCLYIDIDHFKQINDRIGHRAGDEVLRNVAGRIKAELRLSDAFGRFGGEEFVVLLVDAKPADAFNVAERIRLSIAEQPVRLGSGERLEVTVSIGVAALVWPEGDETIETIAQNFVARADQALYQAKAGGRNRVVSHCE